MPDDDKKPEESQADKVDRMAHDHNVEGDHETSRHTSKGHILLRKPPIMTDDDHWLKKKQEKKSDD